MRIKTHEARKNRKRKPFQKDITQEQHKRRKSERRNIFFALCSPSLHCLLLSIFLPFLFLSFSHSLFSHFLFSSFISFFPFSSPLIMLLSHLLVFSSYQYSLLSFCEYFLLSSFFVMVFVFFQSVFFCFSFLTRSSFSILLNLFSFMCNYTFVLSKSFPLILSFCHPFLRLRFSSLLIYLFTLSSLTLAALVPYPSLFLLLSHVFVVSHSSSRFLPCFLMVLFHHCPSLLILFFFLLSCLSSVNIYPTLYH